MIVPLPYYALINPRVVLVVLLRDAVQVLLIYSFRKTDWLFKSQKSFDASKLQLLHHTVLPYFLLGGPKLASLTVTIYIASSSALVTT